VNDTWLGPVLVVGGVLTPDPLAQPAETAAGLWPAVVGAGLELRTQMRTASLPVIVLTAQHGESEEKALDLGAQDYLTKPVQTRSLVARVRAVLKRVNS